MQKGNMKEGIFCVDVLKKTNMCVCGKRWGGGGRGGEGVRGAGGKVYCYRRVLWAQARRQTRLIKVILL